MTHIGSEIETKSASLTWLMFLSILPLTITGCSSHMNPDIKQNPHPTMVYEITMIIDGAPGPFDAVGGFMQYEVTNKACVPVTGGPMNAMRLAPMSDPHITFQKVTDNIYKGTVSADYFQDEDYFGLGVCHWSLMNIETDLSVNKLSLVSSMSPEQLFAQTPVTWYFVRQDYLSNGLERNSFGELERSRYPPDRQEGIFSVTLTAKEVRP